MPHTEGAAAIRSRRQRAPQPSGAATTRGCATEYRPASVALVASVRMSTKSERRAAREEVAAYHQARLAELVQRVGEAVDRFRAGELDAFEADQIIFQYSRSAKELWKFCNIPDVESTARWVRESPRVDWWERGAPKRR